MSLNLSSSRCTAEDEKHIQLDGEIMCILGETSMKIKKSKKERKGIRQNNKMAKRQNNINVY